MFTCMRCLADTDNDDDLCDDCANECQLCHDYPRVEGEDYCEKCVDSHL